MNGARTSSAHTSKTTFEGGNEENIQAYRCPCRRTKGVDATTVSRWRSVRNKRGDPQNLMDMPLDAMKEICLVLFPQELLSVSHVTRKFDAHLMSKRSPWIWKQSSDRVVGLPKHPGEFIELAWIANVCQTVRL
ncbi:hypothetical protein C8Q72DRAFT_433555 [Fomitopsis betulina]|nr:hypothetical protein C8Q72DRAFT_433555 [Fomitopsis betulina]